MADTIVEYAKLSNEEQQRLRDFYEEIRKHDEATALGSARREGIAEGRAAGIAEGRAEGRAEERIALAEKMRQNGYTEEQIKQLLGDDYSG
jgi:predicted transposase YdaD